MIAKLTNLFWLWTILGVSYAWLLPSHFTWFVPYITPALAIIMLGMGMTLRTSDFLTVLKRPIGIAIGVGAQFIIMPSLGYCIAKAFNLEPGLAAGLILVSCCPGGTASNVIVFLARGNVSLSVLMTMTSTLLAVILTPYLTGWLAGSYVPIDEVALLKKTLTVVLLPVLLGLALNHWGTRYIKPISTYSPLVSVIAIILIVGCIIALKKDAIVSAGWPLIFAVFLLHSIAFLLGYLVAQCSRCNEDDRRTVSIEVGMQNSGLGASLATSLANPLAPVPAAISAFCHCVIGSLLAGLWRMRK